MELWLKWKELKSSKTIFQHKSNLTIFLQRLSFFLVIFLELCLSIFHDAVVVYSGNVYFGSCFLILNVFEFFIDLFQTVLCVVKILGQHVKSLFEGQLDNSIGAQPQWDSLYVLFWLSLHVDTVRKHKIDVGFFALWMMYMDFFWGQWSFEWFFRFQGLWFSCYRRIWGVETRRVCTCYIVDQARPIRFGFLPFCMFIRHFPEKLKEGITMNLALGTFFSRSACCCSVREDMTWIYEFK